MIRNYFTIALRHIYKNKVYAAINILGLVVGLVVYLFGWLLVDYEQSHDMMFKNVDRIYTAGSVFSSRISSGVKENDGIYTAVTPLIEAAVRPSRGR